MLVGRERELGEIQAALARVQSGAGELLLLAGEPGIGKTRLAAEAASIAQGLGVRSVWGRCWEAGGAPAFWPWREACEALGVEFPRATSLAGSDPAHARFTLFRELTSALAPVAAAVPLLIVLEDLHAADRSTVLLLEFVAGQLRNTPMVVIATYRDVEVRLRTELADSIGRLGRAGRVLQLPRLARDHVATIVRDGIADAGERLVASVFATTQGNPLFVDEVVRDIRVHGERSGLPLGVREVIRQRLAPLRVAARQVLEGCAVLGVEHAAADIARMMSDAPAVLDDAVEKGVLVIRDGRVRFSHALYREALYFDLPPARRQHLHREAARTLSETGASLAELAHHLLEAGPEMAVDAIECAIRAASRALHTFAFEDAHALLERARAAIPRGPREAELRCRIVVALGEAKLAAGDASGRAFCVEAADMARTLGNAQLLAHAALAHGSVFLMGGVDPVLVSMLEEALAMLPASDSSLRARVMARLAAARQPSPPAERARDIELGLEAIAMARRVAAPDDLLAVLHAACGVLYGAVDPAVRLPIAREQARLAEELGDSTYLMHALARCAIDHLEQADYAAYAELATTYEQLAARLGPAAAPWRVPLMRSTLAFTRGRFDESERWQEEARGKGGDQARARRATAFHRIGFLRAAERHAELRAAIPELRGLWLQMPYGAILADARVASVLARIGADDEVRALLARMPDVAFDEEINAWSLADAVWATEDASIAERVHALLERYRDRWQMYWFDCEITDGPNTRALAYLAAVLGRWDDSARYFAHAIGVVEAVGRRALAARMRFELGDLMIRMRHEVPAAAELLAQARAEAAGLGLLELVALIDRRHPPEHAARALAPARRPAAFALQQEGEYYSMPGTHGTLRFKASRGMQYLAELVARPDREIHVLELVGSSDHADRGDAGELVDATALRAYRARLETLREALEHAEAMHDVDAAERARDEMDTLAAELARSTQRGGRTRRTDSAVDRARSAVQRRIKDALARISEQDPTLGAWLRRVVRTGNYCSYRPNE